MTTDIIAPRNFEHLTHPKYRADIDGLRAIAVLSVVGFHAFPLWVRGGFIGVDIFFVISGFLITTIIFSSLERNSFSFVEFYSRRIKRIFPALLLVLVACYAFGWFVLLTGEYAQLGKHIEGGAGFVSNFIFWNESGYFDNLAETKPLLHLWSLGIEEQFYIVWPPLLWFLWKQRFNLLTITITVALISFALNIGKVHADTVAAFYSPQTRFWELMVGSVLAYIALHKQNIFPEFRQWLDKSLGRILYSRAPEADGRTLRNAQSVFGAILIAIGVLVITKEKHFPGWWALLPTVGAVLIISAGAQAWLNRAVLSNRVLVWFGLISFPLYLWHWPLLSFARIVGGEMPSLEMRIAAVFVAVVLAWLTYRLIEKPIRFGKYSQSKTITLILLMTVVGYMGYNDFRREGLPFRAVVKINKSKVSGNDGGDNGKSINECGISNVEEKKLFAVCVQDSRQTPKFALLGDSKAAALYGGLIRTSTESGRWLFIGGYGANGAPVPVLSSNEIYKKHQKLANIAVEAISKNKDIETVVLVTATRALFQLNNESSIEDLSTNKNYEAALAGLNNTVNKFIGAGKKVVLVVDNPTLPDPMDCLNRTTSSDFINQILGNKSTWRSKGSNWRCHLDINRHVELSKKYRNLLAEVASRNPDKIRIFDTTSQMCDLEKGVCLPYKNGRLLYSYSDHISDYAAGLIGQDLNTFLLRN